MTQTVEPQRYSKLAPRERRALRLRYVEAQEGKCCHCKGSLTEPVANQKPIKLHLFPPGFMDHPVHLHHDHKTGMTIGAVHAYCNAELWQYHGE